MPENPLISIFNLVVLVILMRFWLQFERANFYNPFSQGVLKLTRPLLSPFRSLLPSTGRINFPALLVAYIFSIIALFFKPFTIEIVILLIVGLLSVIKSFGFLIFWVLLLRALMSWITQGRTPMESVFAELTEPYLSPIRRMLPDLGGLDLSLFIAVLALQLINYLLAVTLPLWNFA